MASFNYPDKQALLNELDKRAELFISEFDEVQEQDKDVLHADVDRTPAQMLAYQLGWMKLVKQWEEQELAGQEVSMPLEGYKWNQLGELYRHFYKQYENHTLEEMTIEFKADIALYHAWIQSLPDEELFKQGYRQWTGKLPQWPIARWIHINTIAPFQTFRTKIRKWKKGRPIHS
ncbi:ClbS/DfsB family four-helix bundle protein [Paenibacillus sp. FSL K6-1230]|uniref:ClbS/DfsB family four-helix bundle protein n=1 Tax=Paenibacillus sp. FSL K6-1230 TaxID=2921603 RepID=UPI00039B1141